MKPPRVLTPEKTAAILADVRAHPELTMLKIARRHHVAQSSVSKIAADAKAHRRAVGSYAPAIPMDGNERRMMEQGSAAYAAAVARYVAKGGRW